jgi:hypothetical protein
MVPKHPDCYTPPPQPNYPINWRSKGYPVRVDNLTNFAYVGSGKGVAHARLFRT